VFHIHGGQPPLIDLPISFGLLLNLVTVAGTSDPAILWGYLSRNFPALSPASHPEIDRLVHFAIRYARDFVVPTLQRRKPDPREQEALADLSQRLLAVGAGADAEAYQFEVYEVGKAHGFENLRDWFKALYEMLIGTSNGPRMGSFIALYGLAETQSLISESLT
jgi:lysyl-tRNA synthetase class 1